ncbi:MAG: hypothetical protein KDD34_06135, partial [Bdellovibrionales bacterium]|nr:hypothetical protein [Bdellovibrionales bacterium]
MKTTSSSHSHRVIFVLLSSFVALITSAAFAGPAVTKAQFLLALNGVNKVNNRVVSPMSGVEDECSEARRTKAQRQVAGGPEKLWDVKLVDRDGDGKPDEDRVRSNNPSVGMVYGATNGKNVVASNYVLGKRHLGTVAHSFVLPNGQVRNVSNLTVEVEGCPGEKYKISQYKPYQFDLKNRDLEDLGVIELDRDLCDGAKSLQIGEIPLDELKQLETSVIGYYNPSQISEEIQLAGTPKSTTSQSPKTLMPSAYKQYTSKGYVVGADYLKNGNRIDYYEIGQSFGGSGGPLIADVDGKPTVVGMQFMQPDD